MVTLNTSLLLRCPHGFSFLSDWPSAGTLPSAFLMDSTNALISIGAGLTCNVERIATRNSLAELGGSPEICGALRTRTCLPIAVVRNDCAVKSRLICGGLG